MDFFYTKSQSDEEMSQNIKNENVNSTDKSVQLFNGGTFSYLISELKSNLNPTGF